MQPSILMCTSVAVIAPVVAVSFLASRGMSAIVPGRNTLEIDGCTDAPIPNAGG